MIYIKVNYAAKFLWFFFSSPHVLTHRNQNYYTHRVIMVLRVSLFLKTDPRGHLGKGRECAPNTGLPPSIRLALPSFVQRDQEDLFTFIVCMREGQCQEETCFISVGNNL